MLKNPWNPVTPSYVLRMACHPPHLGITELSSSQSLAGNSILTLSQTSSLWHLAGHTTPAYGPAQPVTELLGPWLPGLFVSPLNYGLPRSRVATSLFPGSPAPVLPPGPGAHRHFRRSRTFILRKLEASFCSSGEAAEAPLLNEQGHGKVSPHPSISHLYGVVPSCRVLATIPKHTYKAVC